MSIYFAHIKITVPRFVAENFEVQLDRWEKKSTTTQEIRCVPASADHGVSLSVLFLAGEFLRAQLIARARNLMKVYKGKLLPGRSFEYFKRHVSTCVSLNRDYSRYICLKIKLRENRIYDF